MARRKKKQPGILRITWVKSTIGRPKLQKQTVRALGLRKLHQSVDRADVPAVRGMIDSVSHLVEVEEIGG